MSSEIVLVEHGAKYTEEGVFGVDNFEVATDGMAVFLPDLTIFYSRLESANHSPGRWNFSFYTNPELDAAIVETRQTVDPAKNEELLKQAQRIVAEELP